MAARTLSGNTPSLPINSCSGASAASAVCSAGKEAAAAAKAILDSGLLETIYIVDGGAEGPKGWKVREGPGDNGRRTAPSAFVESSS
jgi:hypothetical protein